MNLATSHDSSTGRRFQSPWQRYPTAAPCALLAALTVLSLLPFIDKAVHVDDAMYLFATKQIVAGNPRPLDAPFNWYGSLEKLGDLNKNPPLFPYLLAPVVAVFGFYEPALHAAMMLPAIGVVLGTFFLARRMCGRPVLATLLVIFSPAFFLSATTIMSDVPMFCFWVWAIVFWLGAIERSRGWQFILAGACMTAAVMCTYIAVSLIPLLLVCATTRKHWKMQAISLLMPAAALGALQLWTAHEYGRGLIGAAMAYSTEIAHERAKVRAMQFFAGPCFAGGCFIGAALLLPASWSRRGWGIAALLAAGVAGLLLTWPNLVAIGPYAQGNRDIVVWHVIVFGLMGIALPCAAALDLYRQRDRQSLLLAAWVFGIFTFTTRVNWSADGRAIMPMAPAIGILAVRAIDRAAKKAIHPGWLIMPLAVSASVSFLLATADEQMANASRDAVRMIHDRAAGIHHTIWFDGHWGFQWYMERTGAIAMDYDASTVPAGDLLVQPSNNSDVHPLPPAALQWVDNISIPVMSFVSVINTPYGAEFYSSVWGPLPYVFAPKAPEEFKVFRVTQTLLPPATQPITQPATTISNPR